MYVSVCVCIPCVQRLVRFRGFAAAACPLLVTVVCVQRLVRFWCLSSTPCVHRLVSFSGFAAFVSFLRQRLAPLLSALSVSGLSASAASPLFNSHSLVAALCSIAASRHGHASKLAPSRCQGTPRGSPLAERNCGIEGTDVHKIVPGAERNCGIEGTRCSQNLWHSVKLLEVPLRMITNRPRRKKTQ